MTRRSARPVPRPLRGFEREAAELRRRARQARQLGDQAEAMELDAAAFAAENAGRSAARRLAAIADEDLRGALERLGAAAGATEEE